MCSRHTHALLYPPTVAYSQLLVPILAIDELICVMYLHSLKADKSVLALSSNSWKTNNLFQPHVTSTEGKLKKVLLYYNVPTNMFSFLYL